MKVLVVLILVLLPAGLAAYLLLGNSPSTSSPIRQIERAPSPDGPEGNREAFTGTSGRGTFFVRKGRTEIDGEEIEYAAAYYALGRWERVAGESKHEAEDVIVVRNRRPKSAADVAGLLVLGPELDAATRRQRLEAALGKRNAFRAKKATFFGAGRIEQAKQIHLREEVEGTLVDDAGAVTRFDSKTVNLVFDDKELSEIEFPETFVVENARARLEARGLHLTQASEDLTVEQAHDLKIFPEITRGMRAPLLVFKSEGKLTLTPQKRVAKNRGLLSHLDFRIGEFEAEKNVELYFRDFRAHCQTLRGSYRKAVKGAPSGIESLALEGDVTITSSDGSLSGDRGRVTIDKGEIAGAIVEGPTTRFSWGKVPDDKDERRLVASCKKGAQLQRNLDKNGKTKSLGITMEDEVTLNINDGGERLVFQGNTLSIEARAVPRRAGETARRFAAEEATLDGQVVGSGPGLALEGRRLVYRRPRDASGRRTASRLRLDGPAEIVRTFKEKPHATTKSLSRVQINASKHVEIYRSESLYSPFEADARGQVVVRSWNHKENESKLEGERGRIVLLHPKSTREGESRLAHLIVEGGFSGTNAEGDSLKGSTLEIRSGGRSAIIVGTPATISYRHGGERLEFRALRFEVDDVSRTLVAEGNVVADALFPALIMTGDQRAEDRRARERLEEIPKIDRRWKITAGRIEARLDGGLPLPGRTKTGVKAKRLVDLRAQEGVVAKCNEQSIRTQELYFDVSKKSGWAQGSPVEVDFIDVVGKKPFVNELRAPRLEIRPEWSLLEGAATVLFHLPRKGAAPGDPSAMEQVRVKSAKDILLKPRVGFFSGATVFTRGNPSRGGFSVRADRAFLHLGVTDPKKGHQISLRKIERIEGIGNVRFQWGTLKGEGHQLEHDVQKGRVFLDAQKGKTCTMSLRGQPSRARSLTYDQKKGRVRALDQSGILDRGRRKAR